MGEILLISNCCRSQIYCSVSLTDTYSMCSPTYRCVFGSIYPVEWVFPLHFITCQQHVDDVRFLYLLYLNTGCLRLALGLRDGWQQWFKGGLQQFRHVFGTCKNLDVSFNWTSEHILVLFSFPHVVRALCQQSIFWPVFRTKTTSGLSNQEELISGLFDCFMKKNGVGSLRDKNGICLTGAIKSSTAIMCTKLWTSEI